MLASRLLKIISAFLHGDLARPIYNESLTSDRIAEAPRGFMDRVHRIFVQRGYKNVLCERIQNGELVLFTRNGALHLVYCLPCEKYVSTIEIRTCWEAQLRLGAQSSSVAAPLRFSTAAIHKAEQLKIEWLVI